MMIVKFFKYIFFLVCLQTMSVYSQSSAIEVGANNTTDYFQLLSNKNIGVVANHTSVIKTTHIVDSLLHKGFAIKNIFCPEHGFRGSLEAGQKVKNQKDSKTGLPLISLYGKHKKPQPSDLSEINTMLFDIQDVGVRCYTYISTLHYVMEACAENNIPLILLDRPNPNGFYIDGPVLDLKHSSFVGLHPVPFVYGMTIGEYAQMINGERWLKGGIQCDLTVVKCRNYSHDSLYQLPIKPSPNLPNMRSVYLYPSLTLFEGTIISMARKTDFPFQAFGHPTMLNANFTYELKEKNSKLVYQGIDLRRPPMDSIVNDKFTLKYLIVAYHNTPEKANFFNPFFYNLAGNKELKDQIEKGLTEAEIKHGWQKKLKDFKIIRNKYLLYP